MLRDSVIYTACAVLQGGGELRWDNWVESRCICMAYVRRVIVMMLLFKGGGWRR
jgi:hypothetical protein